MSWLPERIDPQRDTLDDEESERLDALRKTIADRQLADLRSLLRLPAFKRFLWRLLGHREWGGQLPLWSTHADGRTEGMRDVALLLLGWINQADPTAWGKMLQDVGRAEIAKRREHATDR